MKAVEAFGVYLGLKLHFENESYDYIKYGPKKVREEKLGGQYVFVNHLAGKYNSREGLEHDLIALMKWDGCYLNQILHSDKKKIIEQHSKDVYQWREYLKRDLDLMMEQYGSIQECLHIADSFQIPLIGKLLMNKLINVESYVCLDHLLNFNSKINRLVWSHRTLRTERYKSFFQPRLKDIAKIARPYFDNI